jgi:hypothetical protein
MIQQEHILRFLQDHKIEIEQRFRVAKLGVFGSVARNEISEQSDVDVLVEFLPETNNLWEVKDELRQFISSHVGTDVDICREKYIKPMYRSAILREVIYV